MSQGQLIRHPKQLISISEMIFLDIGMPQNEQSSIWYKIFRNHEISSWFYHFTGNLKNDTICRKPQISEPKLDQFQHSGGVSESSGRADFKTVPGFEIWARFIGDIKGFLCPKWWWPPLYYKRTTKYLNNFCFSNVS